MYDPLNHWYIQVTSRSLVHRLKKKGKYVPFIFINNETGEHYPAYIMYQNKEDHKDILLVKNRWSKRVYCDKWELAQM